MQPQQICLSISQSFKEKINQFSFILIKFHFDCPCYLKAPKMVNRGSTSKHSLVFFHHLYAIIQRTMRRKSIIDWAQSFTVGGCIENWVNKLIQDNIRVQSALLLWQANTDFISPTPHLLFNSHFRVYPTFYVFCVIYGVLPPPLVSVTSSVIFLRNKYTGLWINLESSKGSFLFILEEKKVNNKHLQRDLNSFINGN